MLKLNEGKACDAIVRLLEERAGASRANLQTHDKHEEAERRIELTFWLGSQLFAVEHTGIEPFARFMQLNAEARFHFDPIKDAVKHAIPPNEVIELHVPAKALQGRPSKEIRSITDALAKHIIAIAPKLARRSYADYTGDITPTMLPGVPFPIKIYRFDSIGTGSRLQIVHKAADVEKQRADRIREACERKFPKLARWKAVENARTVLILEDNDIQLTNPQNVTDAFLPNALSRSDVPDETYMIFTYNETWYVWPILIGDQSYFDLVQRHQPIHREFDSKALFAVTERSACLN